MTELTVIFNIIKRKVSLGDIHDLTAFVLFGDVSPFNILSVWYLILKISIGCLYVCTPKLWDNVHSAKKRYCESKSNVMSLDTMILCLIPDIKFLDEML